MNNLFLDKLQEACGVFGIYAPGEDVARLTYFGLHALQHRGQESAGIAVADGSSIFVVKDMGLVPQVFDEKSLASLQGDIAIGHVRYSTTGSTRWENAQPIHKTFLNRTLALAHNGNLINTEDLREMLQKDGSTFISTSDSEVIAELIAHCAQETSLEKAVARTMHLLKGAYSVVLLTEESLLAFRDSYGLRPLCLGELGSSQFVVSSETCGLDILGAKLLREIQPGEMVVVDAKGIRFQQVLPETKASLCIFEFIYFARPDSNLYGENLYHVRKRMGMNLAEEAPPADGADLVIGVPDSGVPAAVGYAERSEIPYGEGLIKNRYVGRTFIEPTQTIRQVGIRLKLNPLKEIIQRKRLVVVDDSIVRGNTTRKIVRLLKEAGAKEVHLRISSPPYRFPCFYGIDTATSAELIAANKEIEEIEKHLGVDSLRYLSFEALVKATQRERKDFCSACLTGEYPIEISEGLKPGKLMLEEIPTK